MKKIFNFEGGGGGVCEIFCELKKKLVRNFFV